MESAKKSSKLHRVTMTQLIARKLRCHPVYVSQVLRGNLGNYPNRDTLLVREIHRLAREIEAMFEPDDQESPTSIQTRTLKPRKSLS